MSIDLNTYYNSKTRVYWHVAFWLAYWLYHSLIYGSFEETYRLELMWEGLYLPVKMGATYFTLYFLLPRFFMNREFIRFSFWFVLTLLLAAFLQRVMDYAIVYRIINPDWLNEPFFYPTKILKIVIGIYPVVALAAFIKVGKHWYDRDRESRELEKEKLEAELKFLKGQIHPHFLFNTLNNLYALTLKQSEAASEVVLKLSDLLNYMLYEATDRKVALKKELHAIETYISLEKIRYGERLDVTYDVSGSTGGKEIPPMLLLPFIENSFKHGVSDQLEDVWVSIDIQVDENLFTMQVENSKSDIEIVDAEGYKEGIGLKNVRRRLELLYGEQYDLDIMDEEEMFIVILKLQLDCKLKTEE